MSQPATGPAEITESLADFANVTIPDPPEDGTLAYLDLVGVVAGVNGVVRGLPVAQLVDPDNVEEWPPQVVTGATMLVKRYWRRRDTPAGVNLATDDGTVLAFARSDPDVAMLLQLGAYEKPAIG